MAVNSTRFKVPTTDRGPTPAIWGDCPIAQIIDDPGAGLLFFDDFLSIPVTPPTTEGNFGQYAVFSSTGGTITDAGTLGGAISIGSDGDNEGVGIRTLIAPVNIAQNAGALWFEARLKTSTITDAKHNFLIGLMENTALSATVPITAAGAIADVNFVGFQRPESAKAGAGTGGATVNISYKANGVTKVDVATDVTTLVADTYVKLGMKFIPRGDKWGNNVLLFYVNGTYVGRKAIPSSAGTDFPNDVNLGLVFAVLNATASTPGTTTLDWWRLAQLFV